MQINWEGWLKKFSRLDNRWLKRKQPSNKLKYEIVLIKLDLLCDWSGDFIILKLDI